MKNWMGRLTKRGLALLLALLLALPAFAAGEELTEAVVAAPEGALPVSQAVEEDVPEEEFLLGEDVPPEESEAPSEAAFEEETGAEAVEAPLAFEQAVELNGATLTLTAPAGVFSQGSRLWANAVEEVTLGLAAEALYGVDGQRDAVSHWAFAIAVSDAAGNESLPDLGAGSAAVTLEGLPGQTEETIVRVARRDALGGGVIGVDCAVIGRSVAFELSDCGIYDVMLVVPGAEAAKEQPEAEAEGEPADESGEAIGIENPADESGEELPEDAPVDETPVEEEPEETLTEDPIEETADEEPVEEIDEEPVDEDSVEEIDEEPADEEPVDEEAIDEEPVGEINEEPIDEAPVGDIDEETAEEDPAGECVDGETVEEEPAEYIEEEPAEEEPSEAFIDEEPVEEIDEASLDEEESDEEPVDEAPVEDADGELIEEEPSDEDAIEEATTDEEPADEEPADEEPDGEEPIDGEPVEDMDEALVEALDEDLDEPETVSVEAGEAWVAPEEEIQQPDEEAADEAAEEPVEAEPDGTEAPEDTSDETPEDAPEDAADGSEAKDEAPSAPAGSAAEPPVAKPEEDIVVEELLEDAIVVKVDRMAASDRTNTAIIDDVQAANEIVVPGQTQTFTVHSSAGSKYLMIYTDAGDLSATFSAADYSVLSGDTRTWTVKQQYSKAGACALTFRVGTTSGKPASGSKAVSFTVDGTTVLRAEAEKPILIVGKKQTFTVATSGEARYLMLSDEKGTLLSTLDAEGNSEFSGGERLWTISKTYGVAGQRSVRFQTGMTTRATDNGQTVSFTVDGTKVISAKVASKVVVPGQKQVVTVETSSEAAYLMIYDEKGKLTNTLSAQKYSAVEGKVRVWTYSKAYGVAGKRKLTFKAGMTTTPTAKEQTVSFKVDGTKVISAKAKADVVVLGQEMTFKVKTSSEDAYLMMYDEKGKLTKTLPAKGNSTASKGVRTWTVKKTFGASGKRQITFKTGMTTTPTAKGQTVSFIVDGTKVTSAKVKRRIVLMGQEQVFTVKTPSEAAYLMMYDEKGKLTKTLPAKGNSSASKGVRTWTITKTYGAAGNRSVTFKTGMTATPTASSQTVSFIIDNTKVLSARADYSAICKKGTQRFTVETSAEAQYLMQYSSSGKLVATYEAEGNSALSGKTRVWSVARKVSVAGNHKVSFRAGIGTKPTESSKKAAFSVYDVEETPAGLFTVSNGTLVGYSGSADVVGIPADLGITNIGYGAFAENRNVKTVVVPAGTTKLDYLAFYNCTGLTTVYLPDTLKEVDSSAFYCCSALKRVSLPASVTSIGSSAFYRCVSLEKITIPGKVTTIADSTFRNCSKLSQVKLNNKLTAISNYAFAGCESLQSIQIPGKVTSIGNDAFGDCAALRSISLSNGLTSIGDRAFYGCKSLEVIRVPDSVTAIGNDAFRGCTALADVTLSGGMTAIGENLFAGCTALTGIRLPDGITRIGKYAFSNCSALSAVVMPANLITIESYAFYACSVLTNVQLPAGVTNIGERAFSWCPKLESITLPAGVVLIGAQAFSYSASRVFFLGKAPAVASDIFLGGMIIAVYPYDDPSYSDSFRQSYGASWIIWQANNLPTVVTDYEKDMTEALVAAQTTNEGHQNYYNWSNWSQPIQSYLVSEWGGGFTRVEYARQADTRWELRDGVWEQVTVRETNVVNVEQYDASRNLIWKKTIEPELPLWGGFYSGSLYNFLVYGQTNKEQDDGKEVIRVVRYTKNWHRVDCASICGANTTVPFDAGSLRMDESGDILYLLTCHEMYTSSDGKNHQSNMGYRIYVPAMSVMGSMFSYASHSFNQFALVDGADVVQVDHGDAYPRSVRLARYSGIAGALGNATPETVTMLPISGDTGANYTGVTVGGLAASATHYLTVGTSVDQYNFTASRRKNLFVIAVDKNNLTTGGLVTRWITGYPETDTRYVSTPVLTKIDNSRFLVMWTEGESAYSSTLQVRYIFLKGDGEGTSPIYTSAGALSDCQPVVENNRVTWYVTNASGPVFYSIDLNNPSVITRL